MGHINKLVYITSRRLFPLNSGDKIVTYNIIKKLSATNDLCLLNLNDGESYSEDELKIIQELSKEFYEVKFQNNHTVLKKLKSIVLSELYWKIKILNKITLEKFKIAFNHIIKKDLCSNTIIVWDHLRSSLFYQENNCVNYLIEHNNEGVVLEKRIDIAKNFLSKYLIQIQANKMYEYISNIHKQVDKVLLLSKSDFNVKDTKYKLMKHMFIDFEHKKFTVNKNLSELNLLFIGSLDWYPNIEGVKWFIEKVMPSLNSLELKYNVKIIGRNPNKDLIEYISRNTNIKLCSDVSSVENFYLNSDVFICPISTGSGINIKVLEALSYGIPIVMTSFAKRGHKYLDFLSDSDSPEVFAQEIYRLYDFHTREKINKEELSYYETYLQKALEELNELFLEPQGE